MSSHIQLPGSERQHPRDSVQAGELAADQNIQITLILRRKSEAPVELSFDNHISREELAELHGAALNDQDAVKTFAVEHQLSVVKVHSGARTVTLAGPVGKLAKLFAADVRLSKVGDKIYRTRQGHLSVPRDLADRIVAVLGFDQRPAAVTAHKRGKQSLNSTDYNPTDIAKLYNFPSNTGKDQTIALIELGGGYNESDLQTYWKQLGLSDVSVAARGVDGAQNAPQSDPNGDDGEVVLDIEVAGAVAPEAKIAVYFASNTDAGFLDAINSAIHDSVRKPSVISISWGGAEKEWNPQTLDAFNAAFHDAALLGIWVCVAAGDNGSSDGEQDGRKHVDFPASSPWVLACGGTRLVGSNGAIESETVWNDGTAGGATGGVSSYFSMPSYQSAVKVPKPVGTKNPTGRGDIYSITGFRISYSSHIRDATGSRPW